MPLSQSVLRAHQCSTFRLNSWTSEPLKKDRRQRPTTRCSCSSSHAQGAACCVVHITTCCSTRCTLSSSVTTRTGMSRRDLLQSLMLMTMPLTSSSAKAVPVSDSPQPANTSEGAVSASQRGVPAVLEGKAKQAVEQALKKAVDKTKVMCFIIGMCHQHAVASTTSSTFMSSGYTGCYLAFMQLILSRYCMFASCTNSEALYVGHQQRQQRHAIP